MAVQIERSQSPAPAASVELYGRKAAQGRGTNWITASAMAVFHVGAVAALFLFSWPALWVFLALTWIAGGWGIGMGYHRLLTHRAYKTPRWVEHLLALCGTLALEGGPIFWVATHRIHHQKSDREGDPHTPRDGKWWSHAGWILAGKSMDYDDRTLARYVPDLCRDRFHTLISKWHWVPISLLGGALFLWGYLSGGFFMAASLLTWGIFLRTAIGLHCTWLVNSATHMWGKRRFDTHDDSTNNWWVALITFGEGWHNNHHAHPTSARHGLAWYEFDVNWLSIAALRLIGLAKDVHVARITTGPKPAQAATDRHP